MAPLSITFVSHLVWEETLFQRPQQLARRLAARGHDVTYLSLIGARTWRARQAAGDAPPLAGTTDERLHFETRFYTPLTGRLPFLERFNDARLARCAPETDVLWLTHPNRIGVVDRVDHSLLVYDVMDHFPAFRASRSDVETTEERLLRRADVVFTGGRAMHEKKVAIRPDAVCFPSGVDVEHFAAALDDATPLPDDVRDLPRPVLGYYGAIDERIDFNLVEVVCRARPDWSTVFIGPLVGMTRPPVDAPNFHWLGPRPYDQLPEYLKAFDIATMPWARSELTAHLSPTKTPEYLAAGRPVVSVPIPDVERDYGDIVSLADTPDAFVAACEKLLNNPPPNLSDSLTNRAAAASWDAIVQKMETRILNQLKHRTQ